MGEGGGKLRRQLLKLFHEQEVAGDINIEMLWYLLNQFNSPNIWRVISRWNRNISGQDVRNYRIAADIKTIELQTQATLYGKLPFTLEFLSLQLKWCKSCAIDADWWNSAVRLEAKLGG